MLAEGSLQRTHYMGKDNLGEWISGVREANRAGMATLGPSNSLAIQGTFSRMSLLFGGAAQLSPTNWASEEDTVQAIIFRR